MDATNYYNFLTDREYAIGPWEVPERPYHALQD